MTREEFIRKWLINYTEENRDQMRYDLDKVIKSSRPEWKGVSYHDKDGNSRFVYVYVAFD
jgi:hypothetical protein